MKSISSALPIPLPLFRVRCLAAALLLCGCADQARVYPLDDAALRAGTPKLEFVRWGLGRGPVTVTMPDGEVLRGEYQVTENATVGYGFAGAHPVGGAAYGSGRPVVISATGDRGTIINCEGSADISGHGLGNLSDQQRQQQIPGDVLTTGNGCDRCERCSA